MNQNKRWIIFTFTVTILLSLSCNSLVNEKLPFLAMPSPGLVGTASPTDTGMLPLPEAKVTYVVELPLVLHPLEPPPQPAEGQPAEGETAPTEPAPAAGEISQWAFGSWASSQVGEGIEYSDFMANGKPDVPSCGDSVNAWAAADGDTVEWIELYYELPVIPTRVNIYQSFNPNQVFRVILKTSTGDDILIYQESPQKVDACPYVLSLPISGVNQAVVGVLVEIDQSLLGLGRNEIDAVELLGIP